MDSVKPELIAKIKAANTVLVTVNRNPSIDQLAACIGMALLVAKLKKHGTAVFSGEVPSTIEFLKPEDTLEKNTDSLRDFIIALDKSKADKLRYKVEDQMVKIFITPYRTSLNEEDLEFSQGDLNVDLVITLGVEKNEDLDQAIMANGNILHDATIISISTATPSTLGSINWNVPQASSLCELVAELANSLGEKLVDAQIATALLTGIVAETSRFSNEKTTSLTMSISSGLMAAGANQQLVATELSGTSPATNKPAGDKAKENGELDIAHKAGNGDNAPLPAATLPTPTPEAGDELPSGEAPAPEQPILEEDGLSAKRVSEPPELGGALTANSSPQESGGSPDPLSKVAGPTPSDYIRDKPLMQIPSLDSTATDQSTLPSTPVPPSGFTPPPPSWVPPLDDSAMKDKVEADLSNPSSTITNLEESVSSPHLNDDEVNTARNSVEDALSQITPPPAPPTPPPSQDDIYGSATFKYPDVLDTKELKPPSDLKAPPYPPPIVSPPNGNGSDQNPPS